jgi:hypothetical protein
VGKWDYYEGDNGREWCFRQTWLHYPLKPGQTTTWKPGPNALPGAIRSFYTDGDPNTFSVGYHNLDHPVKKDDYLLAEYVPAVKPAKPTEDKE